jgi:hypothetical protein
MIWVATVQRWKYVVQIKSKVFIPIRRSITTNSAKLRKSYLTLQPAATMNNTKRSQWVVDLPQTPMSI